MRKKASHRFLSIPLGLCTGGLQLISLGGFFFGAGKTHGKEPGHHFTQRETVTMAGVTLTPLPLTVII